MVMKFAKEEPEWLRAHSKIFELFYKRDVQTIIKTAREIKREQQFKDGNWETTVIRLIFEVDNYIVEYKIRNTPAMPYVFWEVRDITNNYGSNIETLYTILEKAAQIFNLFKE